MGWYTTMSRADRLNTTPYYMNLEVRHDGTRSPDAAGATQGILLKFHLCDLNDVVGAH